jgi:hypothetical protein
MEDFPFTHGWPYDCSDNIATAFELLWPDHNDVFGNRNIVEETAKLHLLGPLGSLNRHYDEQVHIAISLGCAASLGAEQDDLVRVTMAHNPPHHFCNLGRR